LQRYAASKDPESEKLALELVGYGESFLIAEALAGRTELSFEPELKVTLPFHIPASRYVIDGAGFAEGQVAITGVSARGIKLKSGKVLEPGNGLYEAPVYEPGDGVEILLSPAALITPWASMPFAIPALGLQDYQERHYDLFGETLEMIARFAPDDYETLKEVMRIIALKPVVPGRTLNASYSEFPGACVLSVVHHPYEMAAFLIHEMHHSLLSAYEAKGVLLPAEQLIEESEARCYSPWRNDLRPPRGLLHALTVFDAVCKFWFEVLEAKPSDSDLEQYARDQVVRSIVQRLTGLASFAAVGLPTERGRDLVQALTAGVEEHVERARLAGLHADIPSLEVWPDGSIRPETLVREGPALTLHDSLFNHASKYDTANWAVPWMAARQWMFKGFQRP